MSSADSSYTTTPYLHGQHDEILDCPAEGQPLRVIHAGPSLLRGGAEQWLVDLLRFLDPLRVRVLRTVLTTAEYLDPALAASLPIPVEVGQAPALRRAAEECDVLLFWGLPLDDYLADVRPKLVVYVAHGEGDWTRAMLERSKRSVDHAVAVSEQVRRRVCHDVASTVILNGVDSSRLGRTRTRQAVRESLGFRQDDFVLGFLGRFSPEKRGRVLIESVSRLPREFKLLMVGWGAQRQNLMDLANQCIPGRYAFANGCSYLGDYYQAMDAFCLVSSEEGFSLALIEAMLCGCPVIATPVGCVREVVRNRINGVIVEGTAESVADAARLMQEHPGWRRGLACEGQAYAEQTGHARRMAGDYENLLWRLWNEKHPPAIGC
ncbi:MAG TPA: glycosyltransferase [Pirellulales bacterium]|jgi:glycosyltransferase involved in cell wall biosynthesis|nr:glycosyltransferase [Pirellulales bacterium]